MTQNIIANLRLISQHILKSKVESARDIVAWMGAIQAQDFNMAKWAVGLRLKNATAKDIEAAIDSGDILRTHVLRPTWHFVAADDISWMIDLTASRIKSSMKGRHKQQELTDKVFSRCNKIIEKVLSDGKHATRKELVSAFHEAKIATNDNRASHILFNAELDKIICSGRMRGKLTSYALFGERVTKTKPFHKEEALSKLAETYFNSHGPATLADFAWWSGLTITEARLALEMTKNNFISEKIEAQEYWFSRTLPIPKKFKKSLFLLPAFDEFLISYKDKSAAIIPGHQKKAFSDNGIFWPVIVAEGRVVGIWKRKIERNRLITEINFFNGTREIAKELLQKPLKKLECFSGHKAEVFIK